MSSGSHLRLLMLALGLLTSGCLSSVERKLSGRWLGEGVENIEEASVAAATGWAKGTSIEFAGRTVTVSIPAEEPRSGQYRVVGVGDEEVELAVTRSDGRADQLLLKLDDQDNMRWMLGRGRAVLLRRER